MSWAARIPTLSAADPYPNATLALDFLRGFYKSPGFQGSLASLPGLTVSRASVGYAERNDGTLVLFPANVARVTDKGLLVEESRTNLLQQSQALATAPWTTSRASVTADQIAAPDGTLTADQVVGTTTALGAWIRQQSITFTATAYAYSAYIKAGTSSLVRLNIFDGSVDRFADLVLSGSGSVSGSSGLTSSTITALANGWYRASIVFTPTAGSGEVQLRFTNANVAASDTFYAWGAQLENAAFVTSYIPTTSASATRPADSVSIGGLTYPSISTLFLDALNPVGVSTDARITFSDGSTNNRVWFRNTGTTNNWQADLAAASQNSTTTVAATPNAQVRAAISYDGTTWAQAYNGTATPPLAGSTPAALINRLEFANAGNAIRFWNGYVRRVVLWPSVQSVTSLTQ